MANPLVQQLQENLSGLKNWSDPRTAKAIVEFLASPTEIGIHKFPVTSKAAFELFLDKIPHLFKDGLQIIDLIAAAEGELSQIGLTPTDMTSVQRALEVLKTLVFSASITAPSDLWTLRQVLSTYQELHLSEKIFSSDFLSIDGLCKTLHLDFLQLSADMDLLYCRGLIDLKSGQIKAKARLLAINAELKPLPESFKHNQVKKMAEVLTSHESQHQQPITDFLRLPLPPSPRIEGWLATAFDIELGFRLAPLILALRLTGINKKLIYKARAQSVLPNPLPAVCEIFAHAGLVDESAEVTRLGERVFSRASGPIGIVHAYFPYMEVHTQMLSGAKEKPWVRRGENIAASRDANAKTFSDINKSLDRFCQDFNFSYSVFIEHAVGQGEATRQRFLQEGEKTIQYFGADLEEAALEKSRSAQKEGILPQNMKFVQGDIGLPEILLNALKQSGFSPQNAVMVAGNGFHEIRQQTDDKMIKVFQQYADAGMLILFAEETGLNNQEILKTGWNTYHAAFRYFHRLSGQGLRPCYDSDEVGAPASWAKCVREGGYELLREYTVRSRPIFPYQGANHFNPNISISYFCVPKKLFKQLTGG